jgi:hypothetical protein
MFRLARVASAGLDLARSLLPTSIARGTRRNRRSRRAARARRLWTHLELEPLEDRTLPSATIFGSVFHDLIGSGIRQANDPGVAGQVAFLDLNHDGKLDSTVTTVPATSTAISAAAAGQLAGFGAFASTLDAQGLPAKLLDLAVNMDLANNGTNPVTVAIVSPLGFTVPNLPNLFNILPGEHFVGSFDGNVTDSVAVAPRPLAPGTYQPQVFFTDPQAHIYDGDPNGTWGLVFFGSASDIAQLSLAGWSLSFTSPEPSTQTDPSGNFSFTGLEPGSYQVSLALSSADAVTAPAPGVASRTVVVADGQTVTGVDFGIVPAPDLAAVSFQLVAPATGFGQNVTVNYTLTNQGLGDAPAFDVGLYLSNNGVISTSGPLLDILHFSGLASLASTSGSVTVELPTSAPAGFESLSNDYVGLVIDPTGAVPESNKLNNSNQGAGIDLALLGPETNQAVTTGTGGQQMPSIAVDPNNASRLVVAYMDYSLIQTGYAGIGVGLSNDGGKTWAHSSIPLPASFAGGAADPKVSFDSQGHVYLSFMAATFLGTLKPNQTDPSGSQRKRGFQSNNGVFVARGDVQSDGSVSWNAPVAVASHLYGGTDLPFDVMPDSAVDTSGNVYVTWARFYPMGQYPGANPNVNNSDVMIAVSKDGGQTWTTQLQTEAGTGLSVSAIRDPVYTGQDAGSAGRGFLAWPHVAVGGGANVYVATYSGGNFAVFHSSDGGASFTAPDYNNSLGLPFFQQGGTVLPFGTALPDNFRTIPVRDIVADPGHPGRLYVAASMAINNGTLGGDVDLGDIIFARSDDYGVTWQHMYTVGANPSYLNALAPAQRDNTLPVLNDDNGGQYLGFVSTLQQLSNAVVANQAMPSMAVDAQGRLTVIWYDSRRDPAGNTGNPGGLLDVFGTISSDGGLTFTPNFRITNTAFDPNAGAFTNANGKTDFFLGDAIGVAAVNGSAYAVWTDTRNGGQNIFFDRYSLTTAPEAPAGDRFSPNNTRQTATPLGQVTAQQVFPRLGILPGSNDEWFSMQAGATGELVVSVTATSSAGSLSLELTDASGNALPGGVLTNVLDPSGLVIGEQLVFPSVSGQTYLLDVHGNSSAGIDYTLVAGSLTADFGTQVEGTRADTVASGAQAVYRLATGVQGSLQVTLTAGSGVQGSLNLAILGADGQTILKADPAAGVGPGQSEQLSLAVSQGQVVFLQVSGGNLTSAQGSFTLQFDNLDQFETSSAATLFFPTQGDPTSMVVAQLQGPAKPADLITTNTDASDTLSVLAGNGDGTFQSERQFDVGPGLAGNFTLAGNLTAGTRQPALVDLTGNGILDAIVPNFRAGDISVLMGNGDGTFQPQRIFNALPSPGSLVTGTFTGDGKTDVIVLQSFAQGQGGSSFAFLKGRGDGTFAPPVLYQTVFTRGTTTMVTGDFTGNGKLDLIVFSFNDSRGQLFLGNGDGTFQDAGTFAIPEATFDVKAVDLNGDGKLDLVTTSTNSGKVYVMLGNGNGTFQTPQAYQALAPTGGGNISVKGLTIANLDGHPDIVVTAGAQSGVGSAEVILLPGLVDAQGHFAGFGPAQVLATIAKAGPIASGDFTGQGTTDLAIADRGGVTVIYGKALAVTLNNTAKTARNLGSVAHLETEPQAIVTGHQDAFYTYTVPTEAASGSGAQVIDFSALVQYAGGAGVQMVVSDANGNVLGSGDRLRIQAAQGQVLTVHIFGAAAAGGTLGFGAYTLDVDVLPQLVSVQAESALPGGPATSLVLTFQGDRLDPAAAENPANYTVILLGQSVQVGTGAGQIIPVASGTGVQGVLYDPGASVQVASGLDYPTETRQTVTLLFAAPLPAGSYEVELAPAIQAAPLNASEAGELAADSSITGHALVSVRNGSLTGGANLIAANLVTPAGTPNPDAIAGGTPFLTQLQNDLSALLDSQLQQTGDNPAITTAINNEILARFGAAFASSQNVSYAIIWLDPVSLDLQAPQGGERTSYSLASNKESSSLKRTYVEVGGNVEVVVLAGVSGTFKLDVSDVPQTARGGAVVLDSTGSQLLAFTNDLRDGTTQFLVQVSEAAGQLATTATGGTQVLAQTAAVLVVGTLFTGVPEVTPQSLAVETAGAGSVAGTSGPASAVLQAVASAAGIVGDTENPDANADKNPDDAQDKKPDGKQDKKPDGKQDKKPDAKQDKNSDAKQDDKQEKKLDIKQSKLDQAPEKRLDAQGKKLDDQPEIKQDGKQARDRNERQNAPAPDDQDAIDEMFLMEPDFSDFLVAPLADLPTFRLQDGMRPATAIPVGALGDETRALPQGPSPAEADAYWLALLLAVGAGTAIARDSTSASSISRRKPYLFPSL